MELVSFCVVVEFIGLGCAGLLVMAASSTRTRYAIVVSGSFRTVEGRFRYRISLPYRKSLF